MLYVLSMVFVETYIVTYKKYCFNVSVCWSIVGLGICVNIVTWQVNIIILHVDIEMLHFNMNMLHVDIYKVHFNMLIYMSHILTLFNFILFLNKYSFQFFGLIYYDYYYYFFL